MKKIIVLFLVICLSANAQEDISIDSFADKITNVTNGRVISQDYADDCDFLIIQLPEEYESKMIKFDLHPILRLVSNSLGKWKNVVSPQDKTVSLEIKGHLKKSNKPFSITYYPIDEYLILIIN